MLHHFLRATQKPITYIAGTKTQVTSAATTITINVPTGTAQNDLLIAVLTAPAGATTWTTPSGWSVGITASQGRTVFYKTASSSEPANYTFTSSASGTNQGYIFTYRNARFGVGGTVSALASPAVAPSITTTANNAVIFDVVAVGGVSITFSTPTGYTSLDSDSDATSPSSNVFTKTQVAAGATGTASSTPSSGSARAYLFSIYPLYN
jgi:hypothetical protein